MTITQYHIGLVLTAMLALGSSVSIMARTGRSFRGLTRDGKSVEAISWPEDGPKELWKINVGIRHSAVSVVGDRAYTG